MQQISEIDQITKVLKLCGTPTNETLSKITSEEVRKLVLEENQQLELNFFDSEDQGVLSIKTHIIKSTDKQN